MVPDESAPSAIQKVVQKVVRRIRTRDRLSVLSVKNLSKGKYADGAGLWLIKTEPDQGWWIFRFDLNKRRREMGLGSCRN